MVGFSKIYGALLDGYLTPLIPHIAAPQLYLILRVVICGGIWFSMAVVTEIGSERCRSREVCRWRDIEIFQNLELSRALNPTYWPSAQRHCPSSCAAKQMKIRVWVVNTLKMGQCKQCGEEQLHVAANSCYELAARIRRRRWNFFT
mgnify:CR=1 FL=1